MGKRIISYSSRSLTDVENAICKQKTKGKEKEALDIIYACERFYMYLYGIDF